MLRRIVGPIPSLLLVCTSVLLLASATRAQITHYVDVGQCPGPGTGTEADPYCSIQFAVDQASAGDTILVSGGVYRENLIVSKALTVEGEGTATTTLDGQGVGDVVQITADGVTIRGFTIQRSGPDCVDRCAGVRGMPGVLSVTIDDCVLIDNALGISLAATEDSTISACRIENSQLGVTCIDGVRVAITGNTIQGNDSQAILLTRTSESDIHLNDISDTGILATESCNANRITENVFTDCSAGIAFHGSMNTIDANQLQSCGQGILVLLSSAMNDITNNTILRSTAFGINLSSASQQNTIEGNTVTQGGEGIFIAGTLNDAILNTVDANRGDGIFLGTQAAQCTVRENTLNGNSRGVHLSGATNCSLLDNQFFGNGIWLEGEITAELASHVVSGNKIGTRPIAYYSGVDEITVPSDAAQVLLVECSNIVGENLDLISSEVGLLIASCDDVVIRLSRFASKGTGVRIQGSARCQLTDCTVENSRIAGITIDGSTDITLDRCVVSGSSVDGIVCESSDDVTITGGTLTDNVNYGIDLRGSCTRTTITGNDFFRNDIGVFCDGAILDLTITDNNAEANNDGFHLTRVTNGLVAGNRIEGSALYGMKLIDSTGSTVENNEIFHCSYYAVRAGDGDNTFSNNFIHDNGHGVLLGGDFNRLLGNTIANNQSYGIDIRSHSTGGLISGNTIEGNRIDGILVEGTATTIRDNIIRGNGKVGVRVLGSDNLIEANSFRRNRQFGVWMTASAVRNQVFHNNFFQKTLGGLIQGKDAREDGTNRWDAGAVEGGNYWSGRVLEDLDEDGLADVPVIVPGRSGSGMGPAADRFPLMSPHESP